MKTEFVYGRSEKGGPVIKGTIVRTDGGKVLSTPVFAEAATKAQYERQVKEQDAKDAAAAQERDEARAAIAARQAALDEIADEWLASKKKN